MLLSVVFSFRNEEQNIPELVRRVSESLRGVADLRYELIFVDDASTDRSKEILLNLRETLPIKVISMSRQFGVAPCVLAGMAHARGDAVVYMDSDLQDPPELIPKMIERFKGGYDVVHTTRTKREGESSLKVWITRRAYRIINYFSDIPLPEETGDFKLLSRRVVDEVLKLRESDPYMRGLSIWVGYRQDFLYYRRQARHRGQTHFSLFSKGPAREFIRGITAFSVAPLYLSFYLGLLSCLFAVTLILYALYIKLTGSGAPGAPGLLIAISLFCGSILFSNGLIGLYIARIYNEVKGRPQYIVEEIIDVKENTRSMLE